MELTQEHFDQQIDKLNKRFDSMATKDALETAISDVNAAISRQTSELKTYIHDSFEKQQEYIDERIEELSEQKQVKTDVSRLKEDVAQIKEALHLS